MPFVVVWYVGWAIEFEVFVLQSSGFVYRACMCLPLDVGTESTILLNPFVNQASLYTVDLLPLQHIKMK